MVRFSLAYVFHHSQTEPQARSDIQMFEYHTFLHHSQTKTRHRQVPPGLSTIRFYIILKQPRNASDNSIRLSTIRFYIILKLSHIRDFGGCCLSTIRFYIILKLLAVKPQAIPGLSTIRFYIILKPTSDHSTSQYV